LTGFITAFNDLPNMILLVPLIESPVFPPAHHLPASPV
jgi:hypothetical protein